MKRGEKRTSETGAGSKESETVIQQYGTGLLQKGKIWDLLAAVY